MFDEALRVLGGLDVLVNNAGIAGPTAKCEDIASEAWERTLATSPAVPLRAARDSEAGANISGQAIAVDADVQALV